MYHIYDDEQGKFYVDTLIETKEHSRLARFEIRR